MCSSYKLNSWNKVYKAFTLLELLVYMAIVLALSALVILGTTTVQRSNRDSQRKFKVIEIGKEIEKYKKTFLVLPEDVILNSSSISVIGKNKQSSEKLEFTGYLKISSDTSPSQTKYFIKINEDKKSFLVCVLLENKIIYGYQENICPDIKEW